MMPIIRQTLENYQAARPPPSAGRLCAATRTPFASISGHYRRCLPPGTPILGWLEPPWNICHRARKGNCGSSCGGPNST
jgi:hypothetical protein